MTYENKTVKFIKPIIKSDFPEVGMIAKVTSLTSVEDKLLLTLDFSGFESYNFPLMTARFEKMYGNKKVTAKEAGRYGDIYNVLVDSVESVAEYLEVVEC